MGDRVGMEKTMNELAQYQKAKHEGSKDFQEKYDECKAGKFGSFVVALRDAFSVSF